MRLTITIDMDNAAFEPDGQEAARILRKVEDWLTTFYGPASTALILRDLNGNTVGRAVVE